MGLEEGRHLGITGARSVEDEEMYFEARSVDDKGKDYKAGDSGNPVGDVRALWCLGVNLFFLSFF